MCGCAENERRVLFVAWRENIVVLFRRIINRLGTSSTVRYGSVGTLLLVMLALLGWISSGAEGGSYQAFALRHKKAAEVEPLLMPLLRSVTPPPHVIADPQNNQILLRGSDQAQQIVRQFIASVDRPPSPAAAQPRATAAPVVQGYPVARDQLAAVAARLEMRLRDHPEARFTTDPDTSQVIVLAAPEVQTVVAAELGRTAAASGARADGLPAAVPARPVVRSLQLTRLPLARIEVQVRQMLGARLEPRPSGQSGGPDYVLARGARRVEMVFDRSKNTVQLVGDPPLVNQLAHLLIALDVTEPIPGTVQQATRIIPLQRADPAKVQQAVDALREDFDAAPPAAKGSPGDARRHAPPHWPVRVVQFAEPADAGQPLPADEAEMRRIPLGEQNAEPARQEESLRQLGGNVDIEMLPDLDVIILRGRDPDIDEVARIIAELERLSAETVPQIEIYRLRHTHCLSLVQIIDLVAQDFIGGRQGKIRITPLVKPNAVLLIGWGEAVNAMRELVAKLDMPVSPESQIRVYRLRHAPAATARQTLEQAFPVPQGLAPRVEVTVDTRTNALIVRASPSDLAEVDLLIRRLDLDHSAAVNQARIFKLRNTLAVDLANTLQNAISSAAGGVGDQRSAVLELLTADVAGQRLTKSGLLRDVIITANPHTNSLIVTAPADSMDLVAALIEQLDQPTAVAQIKVFKIINGDANSLIEMLRILLPAEVTVAGPQLAGAEGESNLVPVRFSVDVRTNSIIATGSKEDLAIIEALLLRLDDEDVEQRVNTVYRLKNAPAVDVATAINEFLRSERVVAQAAPGMLSPFQQIESEVVVVPEPVSNSLIISATPRFFQDIQDLVEKLDAQPPQVMIQVLIAEVILDNADEFGVELGLQDSVLFDRSILGSITTLTQSRELSTPSGIVVVQEPTIVSATNTPGFNFNNSPLGNSGTAGALGNAGRLGTQGLSNFNLGRVSSDLDYGGLVLGASSDSVSVLIRALQQKRRIEVLGRPQIMTLDNQPAFIQVGERVPRVIGSRFDANSQTNQIDLENTGLILGVTPRISPEGMVVMEVDAEKSKVNPVEEGIPVSVSGGQTIRSPTISVTTAQTTVSATSGETIVLGGLITKENRTTNRRVPYLSDIPILGHLFRYDSSRSIRAELLIFLTPHVVRSSQDLERIKQVEAARMHWCLADVHEIHGPTGLYEDTHAGCSVGESEVVFPTTNPEGLRPGEFVPRPVPVDRLDLSPRIEELPTPAETRDPTPP
jgi:general secretion pathway protein D